MFEKKEEQFQKSETAKNAVPVGLEGVLVRTIPPEFYDGKTGNGVGGLAAPEVQKPIIPVVAPLKPVEPVPDASQAAATPNVPLKIEKKISPLVWVIGGVIILVMLGFGGYMYYAFVAKPPTVVVVPPEETVVEEPPIEEVVEEPPIETATSTPPVEVSKQYPVGLREYGKSTDADNDGLTDVEEQTIYNTVATQPDTDADGFIDGHEVENLYNPGGFKPVKLEEAGLVTIYTNNVFGYRALVPQNFARGQTDTDGQEVLFTAQKGEFFAIAVHPNNKKVSIEDWYTLHAPHIQGEKQVAFTTKQGIKALRSPDSLIVYIARDSIVYELRYDLGVQTQANFFHTFIMLQNSFAFTTAPQYVPQELEIKPEEAAREVVVPAPEPVAATTSTPETIPVEPTSSTTSTPDVIIPEQETATSTPSL